MGVAGYRTRLQSEYRQMFEGKFPQALQRVKTLAEAT
jgi:hypothetical protein